MVVRKKDGKGLTAYQQVGRQIQNSNQRDGSAGARDDGFTPSTRRDSSTLIGAVFAILACFHRFL